MPSLARAAGGSPDDPDGPAPAVADGSRAATRGEDGDGSPEDFVPPLREDGTPAPRGPAASAGACPACPSSREPETLPHRPRAPDPLPGQGREGDGQPLAARRAPETHPYRPRKVACEEVVRLAREVAPRHGLEPGLLVGIARVESAFTANVLSPVAAVGLSQVMPYVAERLGCGDLFDPAANLECGARVLAGFLRSFDGNLPAALSGYNAGYGMPRRARKESRTPRNFQYVEDVLRARSRWIRKGCQAWD